MRRAAELARRNQGEIVARSASACARSFASRARMQGKTLASRRNASRGN